MTCAEFLGRYDIGDAAVLQGHRRGRREFQLPAAHQPGPFILTLYEKRVALDDLPFFLGSDDASGVERHRLPAAGCRTSRATASRARWPAGPRRSSISSKASGRAGRTSTHCAGVGEGARQDASGGHGFCRCSAGQCAVGVGLAAAVRCSPRPRADEVQPGLRDFIGHRTRLSRSGVWPEGFAGQGVIHADLFPDNVFFLGDSAVRASSTSLSPATTCWLMTSRSASTPGVSSRSFLQRHQGAGVSQRLWSRAQAIDRGRAETHCRCWRAVRRLRFLLTRLVDFLNVPRGRFGEAEGSVGICPQVYGFTRMRAKACAITASQPGIAWRERITDS